MLLMINKPYFLTIYSESQCKKYVMYSLHKKYMNMIHVTVKKY
jgi:hypothetical protein